MLLKLKSVTLKINAQVRDPLTNTSENYFGPSAKHRERGLVLETDFHLLHIIAMDPAKGTMIRSVPADGILDCELPGDYAARVIAFAASDHGGDAPEPVGPGLQRGGAAIKGARA